MITINIKTILEIDKVQSNGQLRKQNTIHLSLKLYNC